MILGGIIVYRKKVMSLAAYPFFLVIIIATYSWYVLFKPIDEFFYIFSLFILPLLVVQYFLKVSPRYIHGAGSIAVMIIGFLISFAYQAITHRGSTAYSSKYDFVFFIALSVFFLTYIFLALGFISIRQILIGLTFAIIPIIIDIVVSNIGDLRLIYTARLGNEKLNPDLISEFLILVSL